MRNEPVCRWIREQSGGQSRIVHLGRPWADPSRFDLVVTTPQYRLPQRDNVVQNVLPLNLVEPERLAAARLQWQTRLAHLPEPYIAVIVGGDSGPYTLGVRAAQRLRDNVIHMARETGGSLLISTSARTSPKVAAVLADIKEVPAWLYRWEPNASDNPYYAFLALADELVVTADSISMLSEACATGKPVWMFDLGVGRRSMSGDPQLNAGWANDLSLSSLAYRALMKWGWQRLSRDITLVHRQLVNSGRAAWLGGSARPATAMLPQQDMHSALTRIRALMGMDAVG